MTTTQDNFNAFYGAESTLSSASPATLNGRSIYRFNPPYGVTRIPLHIRSALGMRALDAHVDEFENAYVLFDNSAPITTVTITSPV